MNRPGMTEGDWRSAKRVGWGILILMVVLLAALVVCTPRILSDLVWGWKLFLLVIVSGALGASIHAATSFTEHVGVGDYSAQWQWWYSVRPLLGASIAFLFVVAFRSLFKQDALQSITGLGERETYILGCIALAGLAGMFSQQAINWLAQLFRSVLRLEGEAQQQESDNETTPPGDSTPATTPAEAEPDPRKRPAEEPDLAWGRFARIALGGLVTLTLAVGVLLWLGFRPNPAIPDATTFTIPEWVLLASSVLLAALGGTIHILTSFALFAGKGELASSWKWWYVMRPFISASLGLITYVGIRAMWFEAISAKYQAYAVLGISFLAGMFSKQTIEWLKGVYDAVFRRVSNLEEKGSAENTDES